MVKYNPPILQESGDFYMQELQIEEKCDILFIESPKEEPK